MHAVLAENWVVYTYWSAAELYDASPRNLTALQLVFGGSGNATVSSYAPGQLEVGGHPSWSLQIVGSLAFPD